MELKLTDLSDSAKKKKQATKVFTPEIQMGSHVFVHCPTSIDFRDLFETQWGNYKKSHGLENNVGFRKFMITYMICNGENKCLVDPGTDSNRVSVEFIEEMNSLAAMDTKAASRIFEVAQKNLGMSPADVEELEKNSETTTSDAGSGSKPKQLGSDAKSGSGSSKTSTK